MLHRRRRWYYWCEKVPCFPFFFFFSPHILSLSFSSPRRRRWEDIHYFSFTLFLSVLFMIHLSFSDIFEADSIWKRHKITFTIVHKFLVTSSFLSYVNGNVRITTVTYVIHYHLLIFDEIFFPIFAYHQINPTFKVFFRWKRFFLLFPSILHYRGDIEGDINN